MGTDAVTQGAWIGKYGTNGYHIAGDQTSYPSSVQVSFGPYNTYSSGSYATNAGKDLQIASNPSLRIRAGETGSFSPNYYNWDSGLLIGRVNRHLRGWSKYFGLGYPRKAFRQLNQFVRYRLARHLQRRSQRGWRAREGVSLYAHLEHLGLKAL